MLFKNLKIYIYIYNTHVRTHAYAAIYTSISICKSSVPGLGLKMRRAERKVPMLKKKQKKNYY